MVRINISDLITQLIHPLNLTARNIQWFEALFYPFRLTLNRFYAARDNDLYNLKHNGQVCYLRALLNDTFDPIERRITIGDATKYEYVYFYPEGDDKSVIFGSILFPRNEFIGNNSAEFNVYVPIAIGINNDAELRMRSLLNYYKLASKRYAIIYHE